MDEKNKQSITASYFGKLPLFADFVKHNAVGNEFLNFDKWIQEGIVKLKFSFRREWENLFKSFPTYQFFYFDGASNNALAGNMYSSSDKSGRLFPFLILFKFDQSQFAEPGYYLIPVILKDLFEKAGKLFEDIKSCRNIDEINSLLSGIIFNPDSVSNAFNEYEKHLKLTRIPEFLSRNFSMVTNNERLKEVIFNHILFNRDLGPLKSYTVKIPLGHEKELMPLDAAFWLHLFKKKFKNNSERPSFFWTCPVAQETAAMFLFFGKIVPVNFVELVYTSYKSEHLIDMKDVNKITGSISYKNTLQESRSELKDRSLKDFINSYF